MEFSSCWGIGRNIIVDLWPHGVDSGLSLKSFIGSDLSFCLLLFLYLRPPHLRPTPINKQPLRLQLVIALATENLEETVSYFFFKCVFFEGLAAMEPWYLRCPQSCQLNAYFIFWREKCKCWHSIVPQLHPLKDFKFIMIPLNRWQK